MRGGMAVRFFGFCCLMCIGFCRFDGNVSYADRYVVEPGTPGGTNAGLFTNWSVAATQIQWAIDVATNGETIWVSNGIYVLTNQICITNGISLCATNGPEKTVIDGGFIAGAPTTNNRCLWMSNECALVSGFTISNGALCNDKGAGVWMYKGILSNCTVRNNNILSTLAKSDGAGVYMSGGDVTIIECRVTDNTITNLESVVSSGGGIYASPSVGNILYCNVSNNCITGGSTAGPKGGGISGGKLIYSSLICNNHNDKGAGGGVYADATTVNASTVTANYASYDGGCLLNRGIITNCVISHNDVKASTGTAGGVTLGKRATAANYHASIYDTLIIGNTNAGVVITMGGNNTGLLHNCTIMHNTTYGVIMGSGGNGRLLNCVVSSNYGLGVRISNGIIRNCLVFGNSNTSSSAAVQGGGIKFYESAQTALVGNCTITHNWCTNTGAGIRIEATNAGLLSVSSCIIHSNGIGGVNDVFDALAPDHATVIQYSCLGVNSGFTGDGIIMADPVFKNSACGNYRLSSRSPCINAGFNENWMTNSVDHDGGVRIRYGRVDMGAYENLYSGNIYIFY